MFKRRRFPVEIILVCVRWYCKYGISYRDLAEMMLERGVDVEPSTIMRWVHRYAPELEKRVRWYQDYRATSWRVDETYVKVGGKWKYLFRAVDKHGQLIDSMLLERETSAQRTVQSPGRGRRNDRHAAKRSVRPEVARLGLRGKVVPVEAGLRARAASRDEPQDRGFPQGSADERRCRRTAPGVAQARSLSGR